MKCPWCLKEFIYEDRPAMASQAFRRHVITCPKATTEQREVAKKAARERDKPSE
jgi:hypothetical protein